MTLGTGLFLSALVLAVVILYVATKDRWKWRKLVKWGVGVPLALLIVSALGTWAYVMFNDRPKVQTSFWDIPLTATRSDVKFLKGEDQNKSASKDPDVWIYHVSENKAVYMVRFNGDKIRFIQFFSVDGAIGEPWLQGLSKGSTMEAVIETLGQPSYTAASQDGLERLLSYEKYQTFFRVERGRVVTYGVYDPKHGPMDYPTERAAPSQP
ncbi:hypothetical protein [Rhizobacter sp. Root16D2]|uniref:hypothetical protein n=1 Tax=Rhizobacter sp. Root16D2 TaxID=1736479 RepID=UPI0006FCEBEB|nr:hypothetical protein [Rhizobacter sp. Root16D2]KRB14564.1 hypothetical protein ASE08_08990 [Rhizobacter sp. Root16D2]